MDEGLSTGRRRSDRVERSPPEKVLSTLWLRKLGARELRELLGKSSLNSPPLPPPELRELFRGGFSQLCGSPPPPNPRVERTFFGGGFSQLCGCLVDQPTLKDYWKATGRQVSKSPRGYPRETRRKCRANIKGLLEGHRTCKPTLKDYWKATGRQVSSTSRS